MRNKGTILTTEDQEMVFMLKWMQIMNPVLVFLRNSDLEKSSADENQSHE